jgi:hypothetical protein
VFSRTLDSVEQAKDALAAYLRASRNGSETHAGHPSGHPRRQMPTESGITKVRSPKPQRQVRLSPASG